MPRKKRSTKKPFDFWNAKVGDIGPDGTPITRVDRTHNGFPVIETRPKKGFRDVRIPLSAVFGGQAELPKPKPARVAKKLEQARELMEQLENGDYENQSAMAQALGMPASKLSRLLELTRLAPDIQDEVLELTADGGIEPVSERALRKIVRCSDWDKQRLAWRVFAFSSSQNADADEPKQASGAVRGVDAVAGKE